jgi:hypothetical protein
MNNVHEKFLLVIVATSIARTNNPAEAFWRKLIGRPIEIKVSQSKRTDFYGPQTEPAGMNTKGRRR